MNAILGSMRRIDEKRGAVRVENVYDTDLADLWSAITEPDRLARWVATVEGDLRLGGMIEARFTSTLGRAGPHRRVRPPESPRADDGAGNRR